MQKLYNQKKAELNGKFTKCSIDDRVNVMNKTVGSLTGYDCPVCFNKGVVYYADKENDEIIAKNCKCLALRDAIRRMQNSGLSALMADCTFDKWQAITAFQRHLAENAKEYINSTTPFFFVGGQSGAGKTHICTAITVDLMKKEQKPAVYMTWREDATKLKLYTNDPEYIHLITRFKNAPILYIDDLFKTEQGKKPTQGDINIAFELINYRYNNRLRTIISSELFIDEIKAIDEATGSRIIQMGQGFITNISRDERKNYRLR